jgi:hypothetical protein
MCIGRGRTGDSLVELETKADPCPCPVARLSQLNHWVNFENSRPSVLSNVEIHIRATNNMVGIRPRTIIRYTTVDSISNSPPIVNVFHFQIQDKHLQDGTVVKGDPQELAQQTEEIITTASFFYGPGAAGFPDDIEANYKLPFS